MLFLYIENEVTYNLCYHYIMGPCAIYKWMWMAPSLLPKFLAFQIKGAVHFIYICSKWDSATHMYQIPKVQTACLHVKGELVHIEIACWAKIAGWSPNDLAICNYKAGIIQPFGIEHQVCTKDAKWNNKCKCVWLLLLVSTDIWLVDLSAYHE